MLSLETYPTALGIGVDNQLVGTMPIAIGPLVDNNTDTLQVD
jgi:hypothetical protein